MEQERGNGLIGLWNARIELYRVPILDWNRSWRQQRIMSNLRKKGKWHVKFNWHLYASFSLTFQMTPHSKNMIIKATKTKRPKLRVVLLDQSGRLITATRATPSRAKRKRQKWRPTIKKKTAPIGAHLLEFARQRSGEQEHLAREAKWREHTLPSRFVLAAVKGCVSVWIDLALLICNWTRPLAFLKLQRLRNQNESDWLQTQEVDAHQVGSRFACRLDLDLYVFKLDIQHHEIRLTMKSRAR